jgi:NADP-dependent 3-hydroxy acid dehydrogenase YdfG
MISKQVAIITGGGTGIGAATATRLAKMGIAVVVLGRRETPLRDVTQKILASGGEASFYSADVRDYSKLEQIVHEVSDKYGHIDILVANAAIHDVSRISEGDPDHWRELVNINVVGCMYQVRTTLPVMYQQGAGHIVIVSSVSGRVTYVGEPIYVASKHALVAFADCLRQETASRDIRVTIVEPGLVDTPLVDNPWAKELMKTVEPLKADDCARAIAFAIEQPPNCVINEIVMRPQKQVV